MPYWTPLVFVISLLQNTWVAEPALAKSLPRPKPPCGIGEPGEHPPSECIDKEELKSISSRCSGSGLVGCLPDRDIGDGGANAMGDCLEVYCLDGQTRVCLSGEKCPWRDDDNMKARYPRGLQSENLKVNAKDMTCSPFGLSLKPDSPSSVRIAWAEHADLPYTEILCDVKGNLTIKGAPPEPPPPPPNISKFGPVCGEKHGKCKSLADGGTYCGPSEIHTYNGYEDLTSHNAVLLYSGECK